MHFKFANAHNQAVLKKLTHGPAVNAFDLQESNFAGFHFYT